MQFFPNCSYVVLFKITLILVLQQNVGPVDNHAVIDAFNNSFIFFPFLFFHFHLRLFYV
jgi:hypothetical protein